MSKHIRITKHAKSRAKSRLNLNSSSRRRMTFKKALEKGHKTSAYTGEFKEWLDHKTERANHKNTAIKIYANSVFLYKGKTMITVYPVPAEFCPTKQWLKSEYNKDPYIREVEKIIGEGRVQIDLVIDKPNEKIVGLVVDGYFEGFGKANTTIKAKNRVIKSYLKRNNLVKENEEDGE